MLLIHSLLWDDRRAFESAQDVGVETVGGYRKVRLLGEGARAEVFLGHAGPIDQPDPDRMAAVKVFRSSTTLASIDTEIEALARVSSPHVIELRDLATAPDGRPSLILPRLGTQSLGRLIAARSSLSAGESVTILAPLAGAIAELHRLGVSHGAVSLASVLLDPLGTPVLVGFGRATIIGPFPASDSVHSLTPAAIAAEERIANDLGGLRAVTRGVLERVDAPNSQLTTLLAWLGQDLADRKAVTFARDLGERLFELAEPLPIALEETASAEDPRGNVASTSVRRDAFTTPIGVVERRGRRNRPPRSEPPSRSEPPPRSEPPSRSEPPPRSEPPSRSDRWASLGTGLGDALELGPITLFKGRIASVLAPVRKSVWIAGGAGLLALVIAILVTMGPNRSSAKTVVGGSDETSSGGRSPSSSQAPSQSPSESPYPGSTISVPVTTGDDPVAATSALVTLRDGCIAARSSACLRTVDQADSTALDSDRELLRALAAGDRMPAGVSLGDVTVTLVQRLGDSAIMQVLPVGVDYAEPATILVVRTVAGWRIRDLSLG